jgi:hypothetical protein
VNGADKGEEAGGRANQVGSASGRHPEGATSGGPLVAGGRRRPSASRFARLAT